MIAYVENSKEPTKNVLELISKYNEFPGQKVEIWKLFLLSWIPAMNDWNLKLEAWHYLQKHQKKKKKYFVTNSTKYVQDLCVETYRILMKDMEDVNTWRDRRVFIVGISILLRCQFFPTSPINSM